MQHDPSCQPAGSELITLSPQCPTKSKFLAGVDTDSLHIDDRGRDDEDRANARDGALRYEGESEGIPVNVDEREDVSPDGGYGWVCVVCVFAINGNTWGINSAYAVILSQFLAHDTYPGASALEYAFIGGLSISQALIVAPLTTYLTRRIGMRLTLCIGVILQTCALLGASFATTIWQLFLSQGVCFGWGMGFLYVACAPVIPQWFTARRSLANGICASGAGIWGLAYNLLTGKLIATVGIPWTYRVLALCGCVFTAISTMLLRDRTRTVMPSAQALNFRLFARTEFLLLLGWGIFTELGYPVLLYTLPAYATSVGLSARQGAVVGGMLNLGLGAGRPMVGYYSDVVGRINIAAGMTGFCGVICFVFWVFAKSYGVLCFFALLAGTSCGTFWATCVPVTAEVSGLEALPTMLSMLWPVLVIPTTFAEVIALQLRRPSGNIYLTAQLFTGAMFIGGALCIWLLRPWKISQLDREVETKRRRETGAHEREETRVDRERRVQEGVWDRATMMRRVIMMLKGLVMSRRI